MRLSYAWTVTETSILEKFLTIDSILQVTLTYWEMVVFPVQRLDWEIKVSFVMIIEYKQAP